MLPFVPAGITRVKRGGELASKIEKANDVARVVEKGAEAVEVVKVVDKTSEAYRISHPVVDLPQAGSAYDKSTNVNYACHSFNDIVDNYARYAEKYTIKPGDGKGVADLYQIEGSLSFERKKVVNGVSVNVQEHREGVFEWIVRDDKVTHRRFIPDGKVTGVSNVKSKR